MDNIELEKMLFALTDKEIEYQKLSFPENCSKTTEVLNYAFFPKSSNQEYFISKHTRFNPVPTHIHGTCEINYIYSGQCIQFINGKKVLLKKGDVLVLDRKVPHSIEPVGRNDLIINFQMKRHFFSPTFLQSLLGNSLVGDTIIGIITNNQENNYLIFHTDDNPLVRQTVMNLLREHFCQQVGVNEMIHAYMMVFLGELLRSTPNHVDFLSPFQQKNVTLVQVLQFIEQNYIDGNLAKAAEHFKYSPTHLSRLLKNATGKSFKELIHEQRMKQAAFLLKSTDEPIYTIAEQVGSKNLNYFYLKFKEHYRMSPQEFRNS